MGGCDFHTCSRGNTAQEAYETAFNEAVYEHGHGGYTGTIAEKDGFILYPVPPALTPAEFMAHIRNAAMRATEKTCLPESTRKVIREAAETYLDKWGPAVCVQGTDGRWHFIGIAST
jgi:hypothetical protein